MMLSYFFLWRAHWRNEFSFFAGRKQDDNDDLSYESKHIFLFFGLSMAFEYDEAAGRIYI